MNRPAAVLLKALSALSISVSANAQTWQYSSQRDEMRDTVSKLASIQSVNSVNLSSPYHGGSRITMTLSEKAGEQGVSFFVDRGQFICGPVRCDLTVRFDDEPAVDHLFVPAPTHASNILFVRNEYDFLEKLRKAKRLRVEFPFFREGAYVFTFNLAGLNWQWPKPADELKREREQQIGTVYIDGFSIEMGAPGIEDIQGVVRIAKELGHEPIVDKVAGFPKPRTRVRIGPFQTSEEAKMVAAEVNRKGLTPTIRHDPSERPRN